MPTDVAENTDNAGAQIEGQTPPASAQQPAPPPKSASTPPPDPAIELHRVKSDFGRISRELEAANKRQAAYEQQLKEQKEWREQVERERDEQELQAARSDPEKLSLYNTKRAVSEREKQIIERERSVAAKEAETAAKIAEYETWRKTDAKQKTAAKYGIPVEILSDIDLDGDALDKVAAKLKAVLPAAGTPPGTPPAEPPFRPGPGGGGNKKGLKDYSAEELDKMPMEEYAKLREADLFPNKAKK